MRGFTTPAKTSREEVMSEALSLVYEITIGFNELMVVKMDCADNNQTAIIGLGRSATDIEFTFYITPLSQDETPGLEAYAAIETHDFIAICDVCVPEDGELLPDVVWVASAIKHH